jgi:hypothetical protein
METSGLVWVVIALLGFHVPNNCSRLRLKASFLSSAVGTTKNLADDAFDRKTAHYHFPVHVARYVNRLLQTLSCASWDNRIAYQIYGAALLSPIEFEHKMLTALTAALDALLWNNQPHTQTNSPADGLRRPQIQAEHSLTLVLKETKTCSRAR